MMINGIAPASNARTETARTSTARAAASAKVEAKLDRPAGLTPPSLAADMVSAMGPPLDLAKIEAIRSAIAEGRYAIDPTAIADRMVDTDLPVQG
ncbi:flagellar biosynthesis anti-sigma factor FlgM [Sphingomonas montana]|uniref:flagellar biosynthesis anti-sigma factor FlgM n=1 Tax=Sphingomonas montana TaxID=1843236 RepID=UPI00096E9E85|nr:flagellar biosynthesis anti-sigma factor FlgM [Sphingomonas montana]